MFHCLAGYPTHYTPQHMAVKAGASKKHNGETLAFEA